MTKITQLLLFAGAIAILGSDMACAVNGTLTTEYVKVFAMTGFGLAALGVVGGIF